MNSRQKLSVVLAAAAVALACVASAVTAGGQVVDHDKVVEDPQLDYRKYSKEIAASEAAERSRQAAAVQAAAQSAGADEAAFRASLAAEAQSLNAAAAPDGVPAAPATSAEAPAGPSAEVDTFPARIWIAVAAAGLVAILLAVLGLSALGKKKSRRRRRDADEKPVSLADFARKPDPDKTE